MRFIFIIQFCLILCWSCTAPKPKSLSDILSTGSEPFRSILTNPEAEVQIAFGRIVDGKLQHEFFGDTSVYFYPASTVKMLAAFAAADYVSKQGMTLNASIKVDSSRFYPEEVYDSLFEGPIQFKNLIKKIFVYSDNQAYNTLYRALGKDYINELHVSLGMPTRIVHQLSEVGYSFSEESNNLSHSFELRQVADSTHTLDNIIYQFSDNQFFDNNLKPKRQMKGVGYMNQNDSLINEPFDFSQKNYVSLINLLGALERVARPDLFESAQLYKMPESIRNEILDIMSLYPKNLPSPIDTLADNFVKFLIFGDLKISNIPDNLIIRNKVGWAYGYLTDVAYVQDKSNNVEFFLAATIHVNKNQVYNDGVYEYEEVGLPFLAELGRIIYQNELSLKK